jgi:hypothetical protein
VSIIEFRLQYIFLLKQFLLQTNNNSGLQTVLFYYMTTVYFDCAASFSFTDNL